MKAKTRGVARMLSRQCPHGAARDAEARRHGHHKKNPSIVHKTALTQIVDDGKHLSFVVI